MTRILLADDSPHAQRMGERILREEGFEVVTVTDGGTAIVRLPDVDPDLVLADVFLPGTNGYDLCRYVKNDPRLRHTRVVLTAGMLEPFDENQARAAGSDATLRKPFEASLMLATLHPLLQAADLAREVLGMKPARSSVSAGSGAAAAVAPAPLPAPPTPEIDPERVRAAVTLALDAALPKMIDEITERVLIALGH
jgi:CheY-like chemotaxis protein